MIIDGREIAHDILNILAGKVLELKVLGINPHLVVILFGNDPGSLSFIKQKQKAANKIGAKLTFVHEPLVSSQEVAEKIVKQYAQYKDVHGLIVQRPIPPPLNTEILTGFNLLQKDVDGFLPNSPYQPPVGLAIIKILGKIHSFLNLSEELNHWLKSKNILLIGRGATGGKPIGDTLHKYGITFTQIHSQTKNSEALFQNADIIISATGKSDLIPTELLKKGVVLIGIGVHNEVGKLIGDYDENTISSIASFYTPTPGGTGPVNVACLMDNFIRACQIQLT